MNSLIARWSVAVLVVGLGILSATAKESTARVTSNTTALDRYVYAADDSFSYRLVSTHKADGVTLHVLELTSQTWRSPDEVDRTVWKHWMRVYLPEKVLYDTALIYIGGGKNGGPAPEKMSVEFATIAKTTQSIVVELGMVPNQPLTFSDDGKPRVEDALIAYTWDKFLRTGDEKWPARMPMTKSVVRAMDAVQAYCAQEDAGKHVIKNFVVAGASKRGWTTWMTTAVDKRVVAMVPIVIDMLNLVKSFTHHWEAYGFWAPAVGDYDTMGLMDWMGTPEYEKLLDLVEPYHYIKRFTMPKLMMNSGGDQFFLPDSSQFYWNDLLGDKYLRYIPNTDHGLGGSDALYTLMAFYHSIISDAPLPQYSWSISKKQKLTVKTDTKPVAVKLWTATNPKARDFRLEAVGKIWKSTPLKATKKGVYAVQLSAPKSGWTAHMVELTFVGPAGTPLKFTTEIKILPETLPFKYTPPTNPPKGYLSK